MRTAFTIAIAAAASLLAAPAGAREWPRAGSWPVEKDGPLSCATMSSTENVRVIRISLRANGAMAMRIGDPLTRAAPQTLVVNGNAYPLRTIADPVHTDRFLRDFAAGDWLELRLADGKSDRFSLRGSAAALERLRLCAAALDARLRQELASGAIVLAPEESAAERARRDAEEDEVDEPTPEERAADPARAKPGTPTLGALFTDADYPESALLVEAEGTVFFRIEVRPDGRVGTCTIKRTSGSLDLDVATCRILHARARFTPARDKNGNAVSDTVDARVIWRIAQGGGGTRARLIDPPPEGPPRPGPAAPEMPLHMLISFRDYPDAALQAREEGTVKFTLAISPEGRVTGCFVTGSSGSESLDTETCRLLRARARFHPARDANAEPEPGAFSDRIDWKLPATVPPAAEPRR